MANSESNIMRLTARRKTQVFLDILKGNATVAGVSRHYDLTPSEVESWIDEGVSGMENGFLSRPRDIRKLGEAHAGLCKKEPELKAAKKLQHLLGEYESS